MFSDRVVVRSNTDNHIMFKVFKAYYRIALSEYSRFMTTDIRSLRYRQSLPAAEYTSVRKTNICSGPGMFLCTAETIIISFCV